MSKRKKITILAIAVIILATSGGLLWAFKSGKIKPRAEGEPAYSVARAVDLQRVTGDNGPHFVNFPPDHWAYKYVEAVYNNSTGLVRDGEGGGDNITQTTRILKKETESMRQILTSVGPSLPDLPTMPRQAIGQ